MLHVDLAERARASRIRVTPQRELVCEVIQHSDDHPDAEEIYDRARARDPEIAIATVYRTLKVLEDTGLVFRRDFGDRRGRFEIKDESHHDHLIDTKSGDVLEFQNEQLTTLIQSIAEQMGFDVDHHQVEIYARRRG